MISRRELALLSASFSLATTTGVHAGDSCDEYWRLRLGVIALQRASAGLDPVAVVGDSRIEALVLDCSGERHLHNWGIGATTIHDLVTLLPSLQSCGYRPKAFISLVGINNVYYKLTNAADRARWDSLSEDISSLAGLLSGWSARVAMLTVPPYEAGFSGPVPSALAEAASPPLQTLNDVLRETCAKRGILCVDLCRMLSNPDGSIHAGATLDAIHFSESGAAVLTQAIHDAVQQLFIARPE